MKEPSRGSRRSEEHTSDSSHVAISYAVFCLQKRSRPGLRIAVEILAGGGRSQHRPAFECHQDDQAQYGFAAPDLQRMDFFFFNDTATTEIYTLSLHDALPICQPLQQLAATNQDFQGRHGNLD